MGFPDSHQILLGSRIKFYSSVLQMEARNSEPNKLQKDSAHAWIYTGSDLKPTDVSKGMKLERMSLKKIFVQYQFHIYILKKRIMIRIKKKGRKLAFHFS